MFGAPLKIQEKLYIFSISSSSQIDEKMVFSTWITLANLEGGFGSCNPTFLKTMTSFKH